MNVPGYLASIIIFSITISFYIIWKYANKKVFPFHTYITIYIQYFCAFCVVLIIPLDLALTISGRQTVAKHNYYKHNFNTMTEIYLTIYWTTLLFSNIILIFQEQYNSNGFFSIITKIRNTFKKLYLQFLALCLCCGLFFGILVGTHSVKPNFDAVFLTSIVITNTIWMVFLVLLLGYGLIMVPYTFWTKGNFQKRLHKIQNEIAQEFEKVTYSYSDIFICLSNIKQTQEEINKMVPKNSELEEAVNFLIMDSPIDITSVDTKLGNVIINKQNDSVTIGALANYREKLYWSNSVFTMAQGNLNKLQMKAYFLEDLIDASGMDGDINEQIDGYRSINWSFKPKSTHQEYLWYIKIKPILYKIVAIIFGLMSLCSYLGIVSTIKGVPYNISPYFVVIHNKNISEPCIALFTFVTIGYVCYVTKWALFEMKFFKSLQLVKNNVTWPIPMSANSRIFASLSVPLIFFYLGWLHENGIEDGEFQNDTNGNTLSTVFSTFYKMKTIPILGNSFNSFFPILLMCVSVLTIANMLNKTMVSLRCPGFQFGQINISEEIFEEGKTKLSKRKKLIKKAYKKMINKINELEQNAVDVDKTSLRNFFNAFFQQSKFHCDILMLECDEENNNHNADLGDSSLTITQDKPHDDIIKLGKKIGSFSDIFKKYTVRVSIEEEKC